MRAVTEVQVFVGIDISADHEGVGVGCTLSLQLADCIEAITPVPVGVICATSDHPACRIAILILK
jgi:hypothetical protein